MPFEFEHVTTASGMRYLLITASGHVTIDDGKAMERYLLPGMPYHRGLVLSRVAKGTEYSPEVRKFFGTLQNTYVALAAVVTSPIVRTAINMMLRFHGGQDPVRMFTDEAEALAWLATQSPETPS